MHFLNQPPRYLFSQARVESARPPSPVLRRYNSRQRASASCLSAPTLHRTWGKCLGKASAITSRRSPPYPTSGHSKLIRRQRHKPIEIASSAQCGVSYLRRLSRDTEEQLSGACTTEIAAFDEFTALLIDSTLTADYEHIIFDTAPTGHTIRLLSLPELMGAWMDTLVAQRCEAVELMKMATTGNKELHEKYVNDPVLHILIRRKSEYEKAREILVDSRKACFVFVLTPEKLPIIETQKSISTLAKYGISIGV